MPPPPIDSSHRGGSNRFLGESNENSLAMPSRRNLASECGRVTVRAFGICVSGGEFVWEYMLVMGACGFYIVERGAYLIIFGVC